jgi:hypothetical protein
MITILLAVGVMIAFALLMSVGLLIKGKELKGTCASKNVAISGEGAVCSLCGQVPTGNCESENNKNKKLVDLPIIQK